MIDKENYGEAENFYDQWGSKFIRDFLFDNLRQNRALGFVVARMTAGHEARVFEFGCGIGSNGWTLSQLLPISVVSMDLSESCIDVGKKLFAGNKRQSFVREDVTEFAKRIDGPDRFDFVIILDVLEHIRRENWDDLLAAFKKLLKPDGEVFITCPTPNHQDYLKRYEPDGLQPVDLSITKEDYAAVAKKLGLDLLEYKVHSVWMDGDYHYAHLGRRKNVRKGPEMREFIVRRHWYVLKVFGLQAYTERFDFSLFKVQLKRKLRRWLS